jgi:DNA replication and repair protein RecF
VQFKLGQEDIKQCGELARQYPLLLINPDSYRLLEMGPFYRRQFMDWGLFHVEHEFHGLWQRFQRILKQRNEGLRQGLKAPLLKAWDESFVALAEAIDEKRRHYLEGFLEIFHPILEKWSPTKGISLHYQRGWAQKSDLTTLLAQNLEKDYGTGHTTYGPHRGDLVMKVGGYQAHEVLSRGQQKLLLFALRLTQGRLLKELTGKGCGYLVDDLTAELDEIHQERVVNWFFEEGFQVFLTGVDAAPFVSLFKDKIAHRFHVEHGVVSRQA